jgi:DNA modification methylase
LTQWRGGGSTIDACKMKNRRCLAYDINCVRKDIKYNNITKGFPEEAKNCDLIFLDPPYFNLKAKDYVSESVSSLDLQQFERFIDKLAVHCFETVKEKGFVSFLIQNYYVKFASIDDYVDFGFKALESFLDAGFRLANRISCPQSS